MTTQIPGATREGVPAPSLASMIEVPKVAEVELGDRPPPSLDPDAPDPRDAIEDAAAKRIAEQRKAEFGHIPVVGPEGSDEPEPPEPAEPEATPAPEAAPEAPPPPAPAPQTVRIMVNGQPQDIPADAKVVIKVDGQDREITVAEWHKSGQIESAARKRLEESTAARAEAERLLARAREQVSAPSAAPATPVPQEAPDQDELVDQITQAVLHGSPDEIKAALKKVLAPAQPAPQFTPEQIAQIAASTYRQEHQQQRLEETFGEIATKHQAVFQDEALGAAVAARSARMMKEDLIEAGADPAKINAMPQDAIANWHARFRNAVDYRGRSLEAIFRSAAESVERDFVRKETPASPATPPATQARLDAKRGAPQAPPAATARPRTTVPTRKTAAQVIAEEQKARSVPR